MTSSQPQPPLEGDPSGVTEQPSPVRGRLPVIAGGVIAALAVLAAVIAFALPTDNAGPSKGVDSVAPGGVPASSLEQQPRSERLGSESP